MACLGKKAAAALEKAASVKGHKKAAAALEKAASREEEQLASACSSSQERPGLESPALVSRARAAGSRVAHLEAKDLQDSLGFGGATVAKAVYKKPSQASGVLKRPAALEKDSNLKKAKGGRQPWMRIKKIVARGHISLAPQ